MNSLQLSLDNLPDINGNRNRWKNFQAFQELSDLEIKLQEKSNTLPGLEIFPSQNNIFRAFSYFQPEDTRLVIIGQDCYHAPEQAIGLAFGVDSTKTKCPPSLANIRREIKNDLDLELTDLSLESWAKQGVLLLNCALTVIRGQAGSMLKCWQPTTDSLIRELSSKHPNLVFMLWGKFAHHKEKLFPTNHNHVIFKSVHPSPLSANRGGWFNQKQFSSVNETLTHLGYPPIQWV